MSAWTCIAPLTVTSKLTGSGVFVAAPAAEGTRSATTSTTGMKMRIRGVMACSVHDVPCEALAGALRQRHECGHRTDPLADGCETRRHGRQDQPRREAGRG